MERLWYVLDFPQLILPHASLYFQPACTSQHTQTNRQFGGPGTAPKSEGRPMCHEALVWFSYTTRHVFMCGLVAQPTRADVLTPSKEMEPDVSVMQLNTSNFRHLNYFAVCGDIRATQKCNSVEWKMNECNCIYFACLRSWEIVNRFKFLFSLVERVELRDSKSSIPMVLLQLRSPLLWYSTWGSWEQHQPATIAHLAPRWPCGSQHRIPARGHRAHLLSHIKVTDSSRWGKAGYIWIGVLALLFLTTLEEDERERCSAIDQTFSFPLQSES